MEGETRPRCAQTGLSVPECSCQRCLEQMLREFSPELLSGELIVKRLVPDARDGRRRAA